MTVSRITALVAGVVLLATAGCGSAPEAVKRHIVMFNADGVPVDPTGNSFGAILPYREMLDEEFDTYLNELFDRAAEVGEERKNRGTPLKGILVFVHGGLNTQRGTIERAVDKYEKILQDGYYPIFLNWQSSLFTSYFDHLLFIRQGTDWGGWGVVFAPVYLFQDLVRGAGRAPFVWGTLVQRLWDGLPFIESDSGEAATSIASALEARYSGPAKDKYSDASPITVGEDQRSRWAVAWSGLMGTATLPLKFAESPLVDTVGSSAWEIMLRRVDLLFHREEDFLRGVVGQHVDGGIPKFLLKLKKFQKEKKWKVTIAGHSTGANIINRILSLESDVPKFDMIIYMAAASGVNEFESSVYPYLAKHKKTTFYHLTLHPNADITEAPFFDLVPRGSLLVWLDDFLAKPRTAMDRTSGIAHTMFLAAHHMDKKIRERVHFKVCSFGGDSTDTDPQGHGDIVDSFPFWREKFYHPDPDPKVLAAKRFE